VFARVRYHADVRRRFALALVACVCLAGCDKKEPETPDPGNPSGDVQVAPGDRLGWTQPAPDTADIAAVQFALYIDGTRTTLSGAGCTRAGSAFECSAVLPTLTAGTHTLELAAFVTEGSVTAESTRSAPLRVVAVTRAGTTFSSSTSIPVLTVEQAQLTLSLLAEGLKLPSDLAFTTNGAIFVAERGGRVRIIKSGILTDQTALDLSAEVKSPEGGILAMALDPTFDESGVLYVLYAAVAPRDGQEFTLARFRAVNDVFGERAVLLDRLAASPVAASGALRIGADGKLYVALDSSSDGRVAGSFATYNGKVLRLNTDATTPDDRMGQTPVFSLDHPQPLAMDWQPASGHLWVVDRLGADAGRLSAVTNDEKQKRAAFRTSYALPQGSGASSAAFYRGSLMPIFRDNLFIAAEMARELVRLRFDPANASRIVSVERLLKNQIGAVRVVAEGKDGALYIATESALYRLAPATS
jgi:glucose/arabinose dehydrogenase